MLGNILSYMVMSQDISIGLILGYCSIIFIFGMIIFYVFFENIKRCYNNIQTNVNKLIKNNNNNVESSIDENKKLLSIDLEGFELV